MKIYRHRPTRDTQTETDKYIDRDTAGENRDTKGQQRNRETL